MVRRVECHSQHGIIPENVNDIRPLGTPIAGDNELMGHREVNETSI